MPVRRDFLADYALMTEQDRPGAPGALDPGGTSSPPVAPGGPAALLQGPSKVYYGGAAAVGSGPLAARIFATAQQLIKTPNKEYYRPDPANACASFVSTVLVRTAAVQGIEQVVADGFTRSAAGLTQTTEKYGAIPIFGNGPARLNKANALKGEPGDVVQFFTGTHAHHSGICAGNDQVIAISSGHGNVARYGMRAMAGDFDGIQFHRFTR